MGISMDRWRGKVALVTGASAGIGAAIAQHLVDEGVLVVGLARRVERVELIARRLGGKRGKLYPFKSDVSNEQEILNALKWTEKNLGPIHILINNAGVLQNTNLIEGETEKWRTVFDVNVLALCIATREVVKMMKAHNIQGHIININSISGHTVDYSPCLNVYAASKHAVTALTETLRFELLGSKIKVSSISPGVVATEIDQTNNIYLDEKTLAERKSRVALNSSDCADAVIYVLSTPPHCQVQELIIKPLGEKC